MEADWAVEIGAGLPVIDADWVGFIDLRSGMDAVETIIEAAAAPALRDALITLNAADSPVFTSKCDLWALTPAEIDPDEFGCGATDPPSEGFASWIDVIARDPKLFHSFEQHEAWVRRASDRLRTKPVLNGRVDLVVRSAMVAASEGFGITLYAAGCGVDTQAARAAWSEVLRAAVAATMRESRASSSIG